MSEMKKLVQYAYASSANAERFGYRNGCWCVEYQQGNRPPKAVAGFAERDQAIEYANTVHLPWAFLPWENEMQKLCCTENRKAIAETLAGVGEVKMYGLRPGFTFKEDGLLVLRTFDGRGRLHVSKTSLGATMKAELAREIGVAEEEL